MLQATRSYVLQIPVSKSSHNILIECDMIMLVVCGHDNEEVTADFFFFIKM